MSDPRATPRAPDLPPEAYPELPPELPPGKRWSRLRPLHMVIAVAVSLVLFFAVQMVGAMLILAKVVAGASDPVQALQEMQDQDALMEAMASDPMLALALVLVSQLPLLALPPLAVLIAKADLREALGLKPTSWKVVGLTVLGILALGPTADLLVRAMQAAFPDWSLGALDNLALISERYPWWALWPFIALLPGLAEELFFRGLVQRPLGFGWSAVLVSGLFFAFFHIDPHHVAGVIPLGIWLAWTAARSGSTVTTMAAHVVNNTAALASMKLASEAGDAEAPLWVVIVGWFVFAACTYGVHRLTTDREHAEGAAALRQPVPLGAAPAVPGAPIPLEPEYQTPAATAASEGSP